MNLHATFLGRHVWPNPPGALLSALIRQQENAGMVALLTRRWLRAYPGQPPPWSRVRIAPSKD